MARTMLCLCCGDFVELESLNADGVCSDCQREIIQRRKEVNYEEETKEQEQTQEHVQSERAIASDQDTDSAATVRSEPLLPTTPFATMELLELPQGGYQDVGLCFGQ